MGYKNTMKSIRDYVDPEDKRKLSELGPRSKGSETLPLERTPGSKQKETFSLKLTSETKHDKTLPLKRTPGSKQNETLPSERNEKNTIYINESGFWFRAKYYTV